MESGGEQEADALGASWYPMKYPMKYPHDSSSFSFSFFLLFFVLLFTLSRPAHQRHRPELLQQSQRHEEHKEAQVVGLPGVSGCLEAYELSR